MGQEVVESDDCAGSEDTKLIILNEVEHIILKCFNKAIGKWAACNLTYVYIWIRTEQLT